MVKKSRKQRRKQKGAGYTFGQAVAPEAPYAQAVIGGTPLIPDCLSATRPGLTGPMQGTGGLPGFEGGALNLGTQSVESALQNLKGGSKMQLSTESPVMAGGSKMQLSTESPYLKGGSKMQLSTESPVMAGGRYGFDVAAGPLTTSGGPSLGGYPQVDRIGCEGGLVNTAPPITQKGGVYNDNQAYYAPTAGYANMPGGFVDSVGGQVQVQIPYDARSMNPACLKTGGSRKSKTNRKGRGRKGRKGRKSKKSNRK